mmetsp:Transcript_5288/g.15367  ORF Transcript_5288/g.15367 Transcript_5288/m.15367 type:complete len:327 (+) Transcript_5288:318-1298(+)
MGRIRLVRSGRRRHGGKVVRTPDLRGRRRRRRRRDQERHGLRRRHQPERGRVLQRPPALVLVDRPVELRGHRRGGRDARVLPFVRRRRRIVIVVVVVVVVRPNVPPRPSSAAARRVIVVLRLRVGLRRTPVRRVGGSRHRLSPPGFVRSGEPDGMAVPRMLPRCDVRGRDGRLRAVPGGAVRGANTVHRGRRRCAPPFVARLPRRAADVGGGRLRSVPLGRSVGRVPLRSGVQRAVRIDLLVGAQLRRRLPRRRRRRLRFERRPTRRLRGSGPNIAGEGERGVGRLGDEAHHGCHRRRSVRRGTERRGVVAAAASAAGGEVIVVDR